MTKFQVTMKDPDKLHDACQEAVKAELEGIEGIDSAEKEALLDARYEKLSAYCCSKWFEWGEYLTVEIDTEAGTCTVVERNSA